MRLLTLGLLFGVTCLLMACASTPTKPAMTAPDMLGQARSTLERSLSGAKAAGNGWVKYDSDLRVRYNKEKYASELTMLVPEGLSCLEAARWLGFSKAAAPLLKPHKCSWPAQDARHSLGPGNSGSLDLKTRRFRAYKH